MYQTLLLMMFQLLLSNSKWFLNYILDRYLSGNKFSGNENQTFFILAETTNAQDKIP